MICENHTVGERDGSDCREWHLRRAGSGRIITLHKRATSTMRLEPGQSVTARGRVGTVWVTMEGDDQDYAVRGGELVRFAGAGLLVLEGLGEYNETELSIERC